MKKILTLAIVLFLGLNLMAQDNDKAQGLELKTEEDYKKMEPVILRGIDWLQETPVAESKKERKEISGLLMLWMSGTPSVSIAIVEGLVPMGNPDCMIAFMCGWTKYSLDNNYSKDNLKCAKAAVEHTIEFYNKNKKDIGKSKDVENLIKKQKKGTLEKYIKSKYP